LSAATSEVIDYRSAAMPKTYNKRQIDQLNLEAAQAPPAQDKADVSRFVRFFHPDDVRQIADRMGQRVAAGKVTQLKPETAYLVVKALQAWNATPQRQAIVREICRRPGGCGKQCIGCIGRANAIMGLYEGRKAR
jgi:hypothetical protein